MPSLKFDLKIIAVVAVVIILAVVIFTKKQTDRTTLSNSVSLDTASSGGSSGIVQKAAGATFEVPGFNVQVSKIGAVGQSVLKTSATVDQTLLAGKTYSQPVQAIKTVQVSQPAQKQVSVSRAKTVTVQSASRIV